MRVSIGYLFLISLPTVFMPLMINIIAMTRTMRMITEMICSMTNVAVVHKRYE